MMTLCLPTDLQKQALRCRLHVDFSSMSKSCRGERKVLTFGDDDIVLAQ